MILRTIGLLSAALCLCLFGSLTVTTPVQADSALNSIFGQKGTQAVLHGNTESKVFHAPDCEFYNCKTCTKNFSSAREAEAQGYRPCKVCKGIEGTVSRNIKGTLHANPETGVVHGPSCQYYNSKNSSLVFHSMDEARRQGFRLCSICQGR